jgi:hypothetical protein
MAVKRYGLRVLPKVLGWCVWVEMVETDRSVHPTGLARIMAKVLGWLAQVTILADGPGALRLPPRPAALRQYFAWL